MNVTDERVWGDCLPDAVQLEKYDAQVIPFEIPRTDCDGQN